MYSFKHTFRDKIQTKREKMIHIPPNKDFAQVHIIALIFAFAAGIWATIVSFLRRETSHMNLRQKLSRFLTEAVIDIGLTLIVFIGLSGYGFNDLISVSIASLIGHTGVRGMYILELIICEKTGAKETFCHLKEMHASKEDKNDTNIR